MFEFEIFKLEIAWEDFKNSYEEAIGELRKLKNLKEPYLKSVSAEQHKKLTKIWADDFLQSDTAFRKAQLSVINKILNRKEDKGEIR